MPPLRELALPAALALLAMGCAAAKPSAEAALLERARRLAADMVLVDGHIDLPYRLSEWPEDVSGRARGGDFDYARAREGGLDAAFMSIYTPPEEQDDPDRAAALADSLIGSVERLVRAHPDRFAPARSPDEVRRNRREGRLSLPLGMENAAPIRPDLSNLDYFYERGIRYITPAHGKDNRFSDSSYDTTRTWGGLSPAGAALVRAMNRRGILVDVSHLSDEAFDDVLAASAAPVLATHSSARAFTPGWPRNLTDDMIRRLAAAGGVVMVNFGSNFLRAEYQPVTARLREGIRAEMARLGLDERTPEGRLFFYEQRARRPVGSIADVADHIDHIVRLAGVDHVGFGSDFDGVFGLPAGLRSPADYPALLAELLRRGYAEDDLRKIAGENALRVWAEAERTAARLRP